MTLAPDGIERGNQTGSHTEIAGPGQAVLTATSFGDRKTCWAIGLRPCSIRAHFRWTTVRGKDR